MSKLKLYRKKHNLSREEVAEYLGIKPRGLANYERGERKPDIYKAIKLAKLFNTTVEELFGGETK